MNITVNIDDEEIRERVTQIVSAQLAKDLFGRYSEKQYKLDKVMDKIVKDAIENLLNLFEEHNTTRPYLPRDVPDRETCAYGVYGYDYCSGVEEEDQYEGMLGYMG